MPPNERCPHCRQMIEDWHLEWYSPGVPALYKGLAATDCPLCGMAVNYQQARIGPAPFEVSVVRRAVEKAAEWATLGAQFAGGTLEGYVSTPGPGMQYANYWSLQEIQIADANEQAKNQGP